MNRRPLVSAALALALSLASLPAALAGEKALAEVSIDTLREQIRGLEAAARDSSATPEVGGLNAEFLNEKRRELLRLLASRRAALRTYLATASASLNEREGARVRQAVERLDAEIAALDASLAPVAVTTETRPTVGAKFPNADANAASVSRATAQDEPSDLVRFEMKKKRAFDACSRCESPERAFKIDARPNVAAEQVFTGETRTKVQRTRFRKGEQINVSVFNMNPFLYKYTVRVEGKPVIETEHKKFLEALGGPLFGDLDGDGKAGGERGDAVGAARGPVMLMREAAASVAERAACSGDAGEALKYVASVHQKVAEAEKKAAADFAYLGKKFKAAETQYTKTRRALYDPNADCVELCRASAEYTVYMEENPLGTMLDAFETEAADLGELNAELKGALTEFNTAHGTNCKVKVRGFDYYTSLLSYSAHVDERVAAYDEQIVFWRGNHESFFSALDDQITSVINHPDQTLRQEFLVGGYDTATDVTITLSWQELAQPQPYNRRPAGGGGSTTSANTIVSRDTRPAGSSAFSDSSGSSRAAGESANNLTGSGSKKADLNFGGGPRFALSAGLVYSPFPKRKYDTVTGFERDAAGNVVDETPELTNVVGLKEESKGRIGPLLMLSTRLTEFTDNNVFFSLGITARRDAGNTDVEYLAGPSVNLFDRRLFLTAGGYAGSEEVLTDDVHLGAKVSSGQNFTRTRLRWRPGFSLTYRINFGGEEKKPGN